MPKLMEKTDWVQTVADVGAAECVWHEDIVSDGGRLSFSVPEGGRFHVIIVKVAAAAKPEGQRGVSARDYIGCCRDNYRGCSSTAEIMKELREGEEK